MDEKENLESLVIEFEDDFDEDEITPKQTRKTTEVSLGLDPDAQAKIELANEKVRKLEEKLSGYDRILLENEEVEEFKKLENEFSDVDDRVKIYNKRLIAKQNEKIANVLKGLKADLDSLKEDMKKEEMRINKTQADLMYLNDSVILHNIARKALERDLPDIVFINPKTKKKIPLGQSHVDQALKIYSEKMEEDPRFKKQVDDLLSSDLTPVQKHNRIGKFIVNIFNERIESELKTKKAKKVEESTTTKDSSKKEPEAKKDESKSTTEKQLTDEEKKELLEKERETVRRVLFNKSL